MCKKYVIAGEANWKNQIYNGTKNSCFMQFIRVDCIGQPTNKKKSGFVPIST